MIKQMFNFRKLFVLIFLSLIFRSYSQNKKHLSFKWNEHLKNLSFKDYKKGIALYSAPADVSYFRDGKKRYAIKFENPVLIHRADKHYGWGFVQFPRLLRLDNGNLFAIWNLAEDDIRSKTKLGYRVSSDNGKVWRKIEWNKAKNKGTLLPSGDYLKLYTLFHKLDTLDLPVKPIVTNKKGYKFYKLKGIPKDLLGFRSLKLNINSNKVKKYVADVNYFDDVLKYSYTGRFTQQSWGEIEVGADGIYTCQYPVFRLKKDGTVTKPTVGFYKTKNNGISWNMISYVPNFISKKNKTLSFSEPAFTLLGDGKIISVLRSTGGYEKSPMYISKSMNGGKTFSEPEVLAPNGVLPKLLKLNNGIIVLSSGRPGVQLRFYDPKDDEWTDAFEMLRHSGLKGQVSCGYTYLQKSGKNKFLIIYSDFRNRDENNDIKKAILVREVTINRVGNE